MYFVTIANNFKPELEILRRSCEKNKIKLDILGLDKPNIKIGHGFGFGWKLMLLREYLEHLKDTDIFVFTDAYDVVVMSSTQEILSKFYNFNTKILFSAEKYCWPDKQKENLYNNIQANRPNYLNSGTFMAYVKPFKQFYDENAKHITEQTDDQRYYTDLFLKYQNNLNMIQLDLNSEIFMCLAGSDDIIKYDDITKRYRNIQTNQYPCIIHANGGQKHFIYNYREKFNTMSNINKLDTWPIIIGIILLIISIIILLNFC